MARALPEVYASSDLTYLNLTRLLARLEQNILSSSADLKALQRSAHHRTRVGANIEYARTLLLQLERTIPGIKIPSRKHSLQTDLSRKRQAVKLLKERLNQISAEADAHTKLEEDLESEDDEDGVEDLLGTQGRSPGVVNGGGDQKPQHDTNGAENQFPQPTSSHGPDTSHTLRHRHHPSSSTHNQPTATTTGSSSIPRPSTTTSTQQTATKTETTESSLTHHRLEQETLTDSLLTLATQLKSSSQTFQSGLESEKSVLARAVEGLDKNTTGMEAAGQRMGMLRRMSEGKGWWGRMMIYLWIFGLWIVALVIVYVGPKLRF